MRLRSRPVEVLRFTPHVCCLCGRPLDDPYGHSAAPLPVGALVVPAMTLLLLG
jgi:hypothetical protein